MESFTDTLADFMVNCPDAATPEEEKIKQKIWTFLHKS